MFTKIPYKVIKDIPFITAFDVYTVNEAVTLEQVCKEFDFGNNRQIREVGILTTIYAQPIANWNREKDPKRLITEPVLGISKNKKGLDMVCIVNLSALGVSNAL